MFDFLVMLVTLSVTAEMPAPVCEPGTYCKLHGR